MQLKTFFTTLLIIVAMLICIFILAPIILYFIFQNNIKNDSMSLNENTNLYFADKKINYSLPARLKIPKIDVDIPVEGVGLTPLGAMDLPTGSKNVGWFELGPRPGEVGSAVIGGHFGIRNGVKFVFYDLHKLVVGDKIYIENEKGETLTFQVRKIEVFNKNADATSVFTSSDGLAHLNLITCEGSWNRFEGTHNERRVVFTDMVPSEK